MKSAGGGYITRPVKNIPSTTLVSEEGTPACTRVWVGKDGDLFKQTHGLSLVKCAGV